MKNNEYIFNDENSFRKILRFCKRHFQNVRVLKNKGVKMAKMSQGYPITIVFSNRDSIFSIQWNYMYSTLYFGDISKTNKPIAHFVFTRIALNNTYPVEIGNNYNVMFWQVEITTPYDSEVEIISPLRLPIDKPNN